VVHGLDKFKEYFAPYSGQYVFIGGTACHILLNEIGASFRATKDLDIVLLIEALDKAFVEKFWLFINDGGYENKQKSSGQDQFFRFSKPKDKGFPAMIELFSRKPVGIELGIDVALIPLHISDSIMSLSAVFRLSPWMFSSSSSNRQLRIFEKNNGL